MLEAQVSTEINFGVFDLNLILLLLNIKATSNITGWFLLQRKNQFTCAWTPLAALSQQSHLTTKPISRATFKFLKATSLWRF